MDISCKNVTPHPLLLETLFAYRSKVVGIFLEVLGIHEINHIAITRIYQQQILIFSSTPQLEFNLFNSKLWQFDYTFHPSWYQQCTHAAWQKLYQSERYDELYYLKQIKHHYPLALSLAAECQQQPYVFSFASKKSCQYTQDIFNHQFHEFYQIGQYCSNLLEPLFEKVAATHSSLLPEGVL